MTYACSTCLACWTDVTPEDVNRLSPHVYKDTPCWGNVEAVRGTPRNPERTSPGRTASTDRDPRAPGSRTR